MKAAESLVRISIPIPGAPKMRSGVIIAVDQNDKNLGSPSPGTTLLMAFLTREERREVLHEKQAWEVGFPIDNCEIIRKFLPRAWKEAGNEGYFVFLAERRPHDKKRIYKPFEHIKPVNTKTDPPNSAMMWMNPHTCKVESNFNQKVNHSPLSYKFSTPAKDNPTNELLRNSSNAESEARKIGNETAQMLTGALVFLENNCLLGIGCRPEIGIGVVQMNLCPLQLNMDAVLKECGKSRTFDHIKNGKLLPHTLSGLCREFRETFPKSMSEENSSKIKNRWLPQLDDSLKPYYNSVSLEMFLLHVRSSLNTLLERLTGWKKMLFAIHKASKPAVISIAILAGLQAYSGKNGIEDAARGEGHPCITVSPLTGAASNSPLQNDSRMSQLQSNLTKNTSGDNPEDMLYSFFSGLSEEDSFVKGLLAAIKKSDPEILKNYLSGFFSTKNDKHQKLHLDLALALQCLKISESDIEFYKVSPEWKLLFNNIERDVFCVEHNDFF